MLETLPRVANYSYEKLTKYRQNDIVVVNYYDKIFNEDRIIVLRVVATPGNVVEIQSGRIFVNKREFQLPATSVLAYKLFFHSEKDSLNSMQGGWLKKHYVGDAYLTSERKLSGYIQSRIIDSFKRDFFPKTLTQNAVVGSSTFNWNMDNFGPLKIKVIGEKIGLDERLYYYDYKLSSTDVSEDFYFLVADNFYQSMDSRIIGLLPKSKILGKITDFNAGPQQKEIQITP